MPRGGGDPEPGRGARPRRRGPRCAARGAEGRREQAGQKALGARLWVLGIGETGLPCQPGARAERHTGCAESLLPRQRGWFSGIFFPS